MSEIDKLKQQHRTLISANNAIVKLLGEVLDNSEANSTNTSPLERTPNILRTSSSGTINSIIYDIAVYNAGDINGTILGSTIKPGERLEFDAGSLNNYYVSGAFTYDATGTELLIIYNS